MHKDETKIDMLRRLERTPCNALLQSLVDCGNISFYAYRYCNHRAVKIAKRKDGAILFDCVHCGKVRAIIADNAQAIVKQADHITMYQGAGI